MTYTVDFFASVYVPVDIKAKSIEEARYKALCLIGSTKLDKAFDSGKANWDVEVGDIEEKEEDEE